MMNPTHAASEISDLINKRITQLTLPVEPARLYDPIRYILSLGGKKLRPLLAVMSHNLFSDAVDEAVLPALAIELFHNFTLVHDDIMDKAPMRRGQATVHKKWNDNVAILSGDAILVKAYELLEDVDQEKLPKLLRAINKTALEVCEGQQLDMDFESRALESNAVTETEYMNMIRLKTAVLFGFSLQLGGIMGAASEKVIQQLYDAGVHLGLAFQLQDDLLDLYGGEKFGKLVGGDILNAKKTYLLVKAIELSNAADGKKIIENMFNKQISGTDRIKAVKLIYDKYQIREIAQSQIEQHLNDFKHSISSINSARAENMLAYVTSLSHRAV